MKLTPRGAPGVYQLIFMPAGPAKRTSVRPTIAAAPAPAPGPVRAPTAATAPAGMPGQAGTPGGVIIPVYWAGTMPEPTEGFGVNFACCTRSRGMLLETMARAASAPDGAFGEYAYGAAIGTGCPHGPCMPATHIGEPVPQLPPEFAAARAHGAASVLGPPP